MLEVKPLCVCEITETLQLATSTVSKHLSILRDAGFIIDEKDGKWVNYTLYIKDRPGTLYPILSEWLQNDDKVIGDLNRIKTIDRINICGN